PAVAFIEITLPIIAPAIISSWLLCFTLSLDDLVISSFVAGPGASTLPMVIYSKVKLGVSPDINALASLIVCAVALCIIAARWLMMRGERRRALEAQLAGHGRLSQTGLDARPGARAQPLERRPGLGRVIQPRLHLRRRIDRRIRQNLRIDVGRRRRIVVGVVNIVGDGRD